MVPIIVNNEVFLHQEKLTGHPNNLDIVYIMLNPSKIKLLSKIIVREIFYRWFKTSETKFYLYDSTIQTRAVHKTPRWITVSA
jgi:hypothetical protein